MKVINIYSLIDDFQNTETDINLKLLKFLNEFGKNTDSVATNYLVVENPHKIYNLLNECEYIRTQANEVPKKNGDWDYNDGHTYDFRYILLDNNSLLVIEQKESIDYFPGDPIYIRFLLYPNAHQFIIKTQSGHRADRPYLNIINNNGQLINEFYFEMPYDKYTNLNDLSLDQIITPISIECLISKYQEKFQNKQNVLCKKKQNGVISKEFL